MKRTWKIIAVATLLGLGTFPTIVCGDIYVSLGGSGLDGSNWGNAYTNIQDALDAATENSTIRIAGGQTFTLNGQLLWPSGTNGITMRGGYEAVPGNEPGANNPFQWPTDITRNTDFDIRLLTIQDATNATLEHLTFRGGNERSSTFGGAVYALNVTGLTVSGCRFVRNSVAFGTPGGGGLAAVNSSGIITNSVFLRNFAAQTTGHGTGARGGAFYLSGGAWTLRDLHVHGNYCGANSGGYRNSNHDSAGGIWIGGSGVSVNGKNLLIVNNDGGGLMVNAGGATLDNLTVSGNDPVGVSIAAGAAAGTTIRNSILYGNRGDISGSLPTLLHNIIGDGTQDGIDNNFADDPEFVFPLFYLSETSPAIDSGTGTVAGSGLESTTSLTDGTPDSGTLNRGYHFPEGVVWDLDLYVAEGGTGDGSSPVSPLGSITAALAEAAPRTRIHIAAGTYANATETFPLAIGGKTIQLLGAGAADTIIDATGANRRVVQLEDTPFGDNRIEGLTLRGGHSTHLGHGGGIRIDNATLTVVDCVIRNNRVSGNPNYGGGLFAIDATVLIEGTDFIDNLAAHSTGHLNSMGGGLAAFSAVTLRLRDGVFSENVTRRSGGTSYSLRHGGGIWLGRGHFELRNLLLAENIGGGIAVAAAGATPNGAASAGRSILENLTVASNNEEGIQVVATAAPETTIRNTISYGNTVDDFAGTLPAVFEYNCFGDGTQDGIDNNFAADPRFVAPGEGNYRLSVSPRSPCIDVGLNQPWMVGSHDLQGLPRILTGTVDLGAYETIPPTGTLIKVR